MVNGSQGKDCNCKIALSNSFFLHPITDLWRPWLPLSQDSPALCAEISWEPHAGLQHWEWAGPPIQDRQLCKRARLQRLLESSPWRCVIQGGTSKYFNRSLVYFIFKKFLGVPVLAQQKGISLGTMRLWVQSLASLSGLRIRCCCELWWRWRSQGLWCRQAGVAPIWPLAWETSYAAGAALKTKYIHKI